MAPSDALGWFDRNTYDADDFEVDTLAGHKAAQAVTVSVVLPAHNEARTIAGVVDAVIGLAGRLVDEVVVLDSGSSDDTGAVAAAHGARVHLDTGVFPDLGPALGKGDALWRSLSVTSGDIVVFVDTDIRNPSPRFISGLLAPLLTRADVALVKAFYDRPIELSGTLHPSGGGRVTELLARPLLNAFWPELSGIVQPLSGEYAGRRSLLEAIPFFAGYGVEIGMLIDTLVLLGADAIAQVDLKRRLHRNQPIDALSRMAYGILQAAMTRLEPSQRGSVRALTSGYLQFLRDEDGTVRPQPTDVDVIQRPPLRGSRTR